MLPKSQQKKVPTPAMKAGQQAWIQGLPHHRADARLKVQSATYPKPHTSFITITVMATDALLAELRSLSKTRMVLPGLCLVIRTDAEKELDNQYQMTSALIEEIRPVKGVPGLTTVSISYNKIATRMGVSMNPGPPEGAPAVQPQGPNTGWIFSSGIASPLQVLGFTGPRFDGCLSVTLAEPSSAIQTIQEKAAAPAEVILILPDPLERRYVEIKLEEPHIRLGPDARQAVFEADRIEIMTG